MTETPNPNIIDADTLTGEMRPIRRAVLALGSNLGDRMASAAGRRRRDRRHPGRVGHRRVPGLRDRAGRQPRGLPDVPQRGACCSTPRSPPTGCSTARWPSRTPTTASAARSRNAPRTLDVDLIVVGDRRADDDQLQLPHPRAHERAFVLRPWHDVEPDAEIPGVGSVEELLETPRRLRDDAPGGPGARSPVSEGPSDEEPDGPPPEGRLQPTSPATVGGSVIVGLVAGWLLHPVADRFGNPPVVSLAAAARAVLRRRRAAGHRLGHPPRPPRTPGVAGAAPRGQPAGAGPRLCRGRRTGGRRLRGLRRELARGARPSSPTTGSCARWSRPRRVW